MPRGRIQNLYILISQAAVEVLLQHVVSPADNEVHDFSGRIDDAQTVGGGRVVCLVEVLVASP